MIYCVPGLIQGGVNPRTAIGLVPSWYTKLLQLDKELWTTELPLIVLDLTTELIGELGLKYSIGNTPAKSMFFVIYIYIFVGNTLPLAKYSIEILMYWKCQVILTCWEITRKTRTSTRSMTRLETCSWTFKTSRMDRMKCWCHLFTLYIYIYDLII